MGIFQKQNSAACLKQLAAQRRLYSDAKAIYGIRVATVFGAGVLSVSASWAFSHHRVLIGGLAAAFGFAISVFGSSREKRKIKEASSVQELFDASVFGLPWNDVLIDRPASAGINEAAKRHKGGGLSNWYADTGGAPRLLDVVMCQRSNLGWSVATHRAWAAFIAGFGILTFSYSTLISVLAGSSFTGALVGFYVPLLPTLKEVIEIWRSNMESVATKQKAESKAQTLWRRAIEHGEIPQVVECRQLQDLILMSRQANALIPDWFYWIRRNGSEQVMCMSMGDFVDEATEAGLIQAPPAAT
ncbi:S-4TM family putative pore-forming effector [Streptomyces nojiriensis]|uniref:S-4TM family putative pore-forming effector n=1 Tax=Streptomyces nojiriensis TaxID=66374 RepID=UPI003655C75C